MVVVVVDDDHDHDDAMYKYGVIFHITLYTPTEIPFIFH